MFNDSSDKSFMVRQISRVAQTIICPFPFEHEACLDCTEKQISNAMRARTRELKDSRIQEVEAISRQTTRSGQRRTSARVWSDRSDYRLEAYSTLPHRAL